ncbi:MAG: excinuclease ABC subunit UvrA [Planctomycetota bacterium]
MEATTITIKGARTHNLKNVSLSVPRGKLVCFTGVSGSGKSSLAFDTLFAEGQRRYLESLSSYARQFLGQLAKPDVDHITGLSPAISIQQKSSGWNPRSTVGTITQIHDYLRVLFARVGRQHCPQCGDAISAQSREQILARILEVPPGTKAMVLAPVVRGQKGEYRDLFAEMMRRGYVRARVDGSLIELSNPPELVKNLRHRIEIVVDRLTVSPAARSRLAEAVENALKLGDGTLIVQPVGENDEARSAKPLSSSGGEGGARGFQHAIEVRASSTMPINHEQESSLLLPSGERGSRRSADLRVRTPVVPRTELLLSSHYACPKCDLSFEPPSPQLFSFNSPQGMCLTCDGMGMTFDFDPELLVPDPTKSFFKYAVDPMRFWGRMGRWRRHIYRGLAKKVGFDIEQPWGELPPCARDALLHGLGEEHVAFEWRSRAGTRRHGGKFGGVLADLREKYRKANSDFVREYYEKFMRKSVCPTCGGARLNAQALSVRVGGRNIDGVCALSVTAARGFFGSLELTATEQLIARDVLKEIRGRLTFLCDVGLEYLSLDRTAPTLSGGESQRIRLASQIGAGLVGVLYILDEPSIGLHPRDNRKLLDSLCRLRDLGNTVIVVEHDEQTMRTADEIIDFGPGPGVRGGEVVAQGGVKAIAESERSMTGQFLRGVQRIEVPVHRRPVVRKTNTPDARRAASVEKGVSVQRTPAPARRRTRREVEA